MKKVNAIAEQHGLAVVEDAAQSFGAELEGGKSWVLRNIRMFQHESDEDPVRLWGGKPVLW